MIGSRSMKTFEQLNKKQQVTATSKALKELVTNLVGGFMEIDFKNKAHNIFLSKIIASGLQKNEMYYLLLENKTIKVQLMEIALARAVFALYPEADEITVKNNEFYITNVA